MNPVSTLASACALALAFGVGAPAAAPQDTPPPKPTDPVHAQPGINHCHRIYAHLAGAGWVIDRDRRTPRPIQRGLFVVERHAFTWRMFFRNLRLQRLCIRNLAGDPQHARIKKELGAYMPKSNVLPTEMKDGGTDTFGRKVERLRSEGVPDWLGKDPAKSIVQ